MLSQNYLSQSADMSLMMSPVPLIIRVRARIFVTAAVLSMMAACGSAPDTPVTGDQRIPIRPDETQYCQPLSPNPEASTISSGEGEYFWAEGGTCIRRPLREAWAVIHNTELMNWRGTTSYKVMDAGGIPDGFTHHTKIEYAVKKFMVTTTWIMEWHHSIQAGSFEEPNKIVVNYQRTEGTQHIEYWQGSIVLEALQDGTTAFWMRDQIRRTQGAPEKCVETVEQVIEKIRTGAPNWDALEAGAHVVHPAAAFNNF
jgi:hypothetical protein